MLKAQPIHETMAGGGGEKRLHRSTEFFSCQALLSVFSSSFGSPTSVLSRALSRVPLSSFFLPYSLRRFTGKDEFKRRRIQDLLSGVNA